MLTERSISSSILWHVPPWQTIADHGRVYCDITSRQSRQRLRITHTRRRQCRMLFNPLRPAPTIPASRFLRSSPLTRSCLGLVIRQVSSYPTIRATPVEGMCMNHSLGCVRRPMGRFHWHHLRTRVLPAYITIILHPHTPLIIIGVADVAFNSCLGIHAILRTTGT